MLQDKKYLMIPGPTPIPPAVQQAMIRPMIGHRSGDFAKLHERLIKKAKQVFQTEKDLFILTQSGTGGLETAVANVISPGDRVLALITGNFGERFAKIARFYGAEVDAMEFPWGEAIDLKQVEAKLAANQYRAVLATHNETSTGVANDIGGLGALVARTEALLLVDAVSSMGGMDIRTDEWQVDIMVTGSQKALMLPPGLALVSVSEKAWQAMETAKAPRFYFCLKQARKNMAEWNTAWTPNVTLFYGLEAALDMILAEGLPEVFARHALLTKATRAAIRALGLELLADDAVASHTVTSVKGNDRLNTEDLRRVLRTKFGVTFAGGQGKLKGKIFRIGHMGYADTLDIILAIGALEMALAQVGYPVQLGVGVAAAQKVFLEG